MEISRKFNLEKILYFTILVGSLRNNRMRRHLVRSFNFLTLTLVVIVVLLWARVNLGSSLTSVAQAQSCPPVQNTPRFTIVWGTVQWNGQNAPVGAVVEARTPAARGGDTVGCTTVTDPGKVPAMFVYGEDTSVTPSVPGMKINEPIEFFVSGAPATLDEVLLWSNDWQTGLLHTVILTATGSAVPVADFSGTPTSGTAPLAVQFIDASTSDITARLWAFGDGTAGSTLTSPSHTYNSAGIYTVTLTVNGAGGSDVTTKTNYQYRAAASHWD